MQQLSSNNNLGNTKSNLENLQMLLAFKLLAINLPSEVELDLTADFKDHEMYKLYQSKVVELKKNPNSSVKVSNIDAVALCLVEDYPKNTLARNSCSPTVTFLSEALLRVTSTTLEISPWTYFKEYKFVHQHLCFILDELLPHSYSTQNDLTIVSLAKVQSYFFILAASICQKFKNIFIMYLNKRWLTLRTVAKGSSPSEDASLETYSPLKCFQLIDRIPKLTLSEIVPKAFSFEGFVLLVAMQEETVDYDMLKTIFDSRFDINSKDERGFTILDNAVMENRVDTANILLGLRNKSDMLYYRGQNLLHTIVRLQQQEMFKTVVNLPFPNINEKDNDGNTALHVALMQSNPSDELHNMVNELLRRGARLDINNESWETPISLATKRNDGLGRAVLETIGLYKRRVLLNH